MLATLSITNLIVELEYLTVDFEISLTRPGLGLRLRAYSLIGFNGRVTFWLQRVRPLPCTCAYVALFARRLVYNQGFWIYLYFRIRHSFTHLRPVILPADWSISRLQSWTCLSLPTVAEFVILTESIIIEIQRQSADLYKVQLCNRQFFCGVHSGLRGKDIRVSPAWYNHYAIAHAYNAVNAHPQGSDRACWSQKVTLSSKAIGV